MGDGRTGPPVGAMGTGFRKNEVTHESQVTWFGNKVLVINYLAEFTPQCNPQILRRRRNNKIEDDRRLKRLFFFYISFQFLLFFFAPLRLCAFALRFS